MAQGKAGPETVAVTGATGFLGKALVEKVLRSIPDVRRIYLLIRPKGRGARIKSAQHRFRNVHAILLH